MDAADIADDLRGIAQALQVAASQIDAEEFDSAIVSVDEACGFAPLPEYAAMLEDVEFSDEEEDE